MSKKEAYEVTRRVMSVPEIARAYGMSPSGVYNLLRDGELTPVIRIGKSIRIPVEAVEAWEKRNTAAWTAAYDTAG